MSGVSRARIDDVVIEQARGLARNIEAGSRMDITRYIGVVWRISVRVPRASHMSVQRHKAGIQRCSTTSSLIRAAFVARRCSTFTACFTQCFTRATIRHRSRRSTHINRTHTAQRPQVVARRRQGRHSARRQLHDASDRRGPAMRVAQTRAPRRTVCPSPRHRHRRGPHRHQHAERPHGHRQVAARVGGVSLCNATQVEARAGNIHATRGLTGNPHRPPPLTNARQQSPRRRPQRCLHNMLRRRGRQGHTRDIRGPHRLDVPRGNERPDQRVERSPGRLRERQSVTQQPVGFFTNDEAGADHRVISPATGCTVTAASQSNNRIESRHLGRRPEHAPHVLVARHDLDEGVDDRHAVPAPADDVDAGAHPGEGGAPHGRYPRGPGHGLVPRAAHRASTARGLSRRSLRGPYRGRRPSWRRSGRGC